jgi:hypothetical protein
MVIKECLDCEEKLLEMLREIRLNVSDCGHGGMHHRSGPHDEDGMQNAAGEPHGNRKKPI